MGAFQDRLLRAGSVGAFWMRNVETPLFSLASTMSTVIKKADRKNQAVDRQVVTSNFSARLTEIEPNHTKGPGELLPGLFLEKPGSMILNDLYNDFFGTQHRN